MSYVGMTILIFGLVMFYSMPDMDDKLETIYAYLSVFCMLSGLITLIWSSTV